MTTPSRSMRTRRYRPWLALLGTLYAAGCSTTTPQDVKALPVQCSLRRTDGLIGTMTARFPNGETYSGPFFQITADTRVDSLSGLWEGWRPRWYPLWRRRWREEEWQYWRPGPDFISHYSGRLVANLLNSRGKHVRCEFDLEDPAHGLAAGGRGRCQRSDRKTIEAMFDTR